MNGNDKESKTYSSQKTYIYLLNALSTISVVFLHTNGCFWSYSKRNWWRSANIIESVFYFAVPCFFMITGVTLLDYNNKYSIKTYFSKRISKTFIPFVFWEVIALIYRCLTGEFYAKITNPIQTINEFVNGRLVGIYWFFPALFSVYICIPVFAYIEEKYKIQVCLYLVVMGFIINVYIPFILMAFQIRIDCPVNLWVVSGYMIYVLLGYLIDKLDITFKHEMIIYFLSVIGLLMHIYYTYVFSTDTGVIVTDYKGYLNLPCFVYSTGIFLFIKKRAVLVLRYKVIEKITSYICSFSFGIYLSHWYIMELVRDILFKDIFDLQNYSIVYRLGAPFIIIPLSCCCIYLMRKIPGLKIFVP